MEAAIVMIAAGKTFDDVKNTERGLERSTRKGNEEYVKNLRRARIAVRREQSRQSLRDGDELARRFSEQMIATEYHKVASKCAVEAVLRAKQDEIDAMKIFDLPSADHKQQHSKLRKRSFLSKARDVLRGR